MDYRFFRVNDGPVMEAFLALKKNRDIAAVAITRFMKSVGAIKCYGSYPASYVFDFKSAKNVDKNVWAKTKPRRGTYYFRPARTPAGREMAERIKALPAAPSIDHCIEMAGLYRIPILIQGELGYSPHVRFWSIPEKLIILQIPWRPVPAKEMAKYKKERAAGTHYNGELDYLQWQPIPSLHEIKEWEALKLIEELSSKGETK